jgi:FtsP/CotA-like multicopper oxidase with cupredoxin domain
VTALSIEGGWKDATQVPPGMVTTIVARWQAGYASRASATPANYGIGTSPRGDQSNCAAPAVCDGATWTYDDITTGPYVWHCHINSHEDSEMMHTSLVVP